MARLARQDLIRVFCFDLEIGSLGWDAHRAVSYFQYNPDFLARNQYLHLIPKARMIKRVKEVQVFKQFNGETFRGLPPIFADSLPDLFGNIIFKTWLESKNKKLENISAIEQLAYVSDRGMGAFEYKPGKDLPQTSAINLEEIVEVLQFVLEIKSASSAEQLNHESLLNIFKIGSSAGGARPKILIAERKSDGRIFPGDINFSKEYEHYIIKLNVDDSLGYNREMIEYSYYLASIYGGINMMDSKIIDGLHFATKRFDRVDGEKKHVITACGLTGWDFKDPAKSSYENLFELSLFLDLPHSEIEELFRRMVFNIVFANKDDHLKNHSFIYDKLNDRWNISPAYDVTYALNPLLNYQKTSRALSINNKRVNINLEDVQMIAQKYTVKNYLSIVEEIQDSVQSWRKNAHDLGIPSKIIDSMYKDFVYLTHSN
ncbi:MAG: type II toxin-antitoxin system HipA family toxin [Bacteroidota bacterium]